ncbi:MAG: aldo/keto reductase [Capsulimonas sp.]|uniref:aldo/keto reductase n=1 Tax=Capsulimonas sp. TaxID=2494211 RepID=UPI003267E631
MASRIQQITNTPLSPISFSERRLRLNPETATEAPEPSQAANAALQAGITVLHAAHEREAISLHASLATIQHPSPYLVSTTDGDVLARCPATEDGAAEAVQKAIARKKEMFGGRTLDLFSLYDFRRDTHLESVLTGAFRALREAREAQEIQCIGVTCYGDYEALAYAIQNGMVELDFVIVRYNYLDQQAGKTLIPLCRERGIDVIAAQTFSWRGDIPFPRFPNIWRYRNMTKNFYGMSVAQAHLKWLTASGQFDSILVSMQEPAQVLENVAAVKIVKLPVGLEALFQNIGGAIEDTSDGWLGLRDDEIWEYQLAAKAEMERRTRR